MIEWLDPLMIRMAIFISLIVIIVGIRSAWKRHERKNYQNDS